MNFTSAPEYSLTNSFKKSNEEVMQIFSRCPVGTTPVLGLCTTQPDNLKPTPSLSENRKECPSILESKRLPLLLIILKNHLPLNIP